MIANASHPRSQTHRETSPAPEAEAATEAAAERSLLGEPFHHNVAVGSRARVLQRGGGAPVGARMRAAPTETRQRLDRGLTHSLDPTKEGLAMKATQCCYPPCPKPVAKGRHFCNSHEYRWRKGGEAQARPPRGAPVEEALDRIGWTVTSTGCWEWNGYRSNGYGRLRGEPVTRIMWRIVMGETVPSDKHMCHKCDNPPCINPDHLFVGTRSDNMRDMIAKGRHSYTRGSRHHRSKLTDEQVAEIRGRYTGAWGEFTRLAQEFDVSPQHISAVVKGDRR